MSYILYVAKHNAAFCVFFLRTNYAFSHKVLILYQILDVKLKFSMQASKNDNNKKENDTTHIYHVMPLACLTTCFLLKKNCMT